LNITQLQITQNAFVHGLTFSFTDGSKRQFGEKKRGDKTDVWDFSPEEALVGLTGQFVGNRLSKVGTVTVDPVCGANAYTTWFDEFYPPEPEVVEEPEKDFDSYKYEPVDDSAMPIVMVIVAVVVVLVVVAATIQACKVKNRRANMIAVANNSVANITEDSKTANRDDLELPTAKPFTGEKQTQIMSEDETAYGVGSAKMKSDADKLKIEKEQTIDN